MIFTKTILAVSQDIIQLFTTTIYKVNVMVKLLLCTNMYMHVLNKLILLNITSLDYYENNYSIYGHINQSWGFCHVKKIKKSEKNSEMGRWVKPQLGFVFFCGKFVFFFLLFAVFKIKYKK